MDADHPDFLPDEADELLPLDSGEEERPAIEPEIVVLPDGTVIKRYPPMWAKNARSEACTAKSKGRRGQRGD